MKIICVGRNYVDHVKELNSLLPEDPVLFMKPETSLLRNNKPFKYPAFSSMVHYETEIVLKVGTTCKSIGESEALKFIESIGIGLDFTARDIQSELKKKGLPWEVSKAFDHSSPVSDKFIPLSEIDDLRDIHFHLEVNGEKKQDGNSGLMIFSFERIRAIEFVK